MFPTKTPSRHNMPLLSRTMLGLCSALLIGPPPASAQEPVSSAVVPLQVGDRVRVTASASGVNSAVGTVRALDGAGLVLDRAGYAVDLPLRYDQIEGLEVSIERKHQARKGAALGGVSLGLIGLVGGLMAGDDPPCGPEQWCFSEPLSAGEKGVLLGAMGVAVGALTGSAIGWFMKTDVWAPGTVDGPRVSVQPVWVPGNAALGFRITF